MKNSFKRLIDILSLRRPHGLYGEFELISTHILPLNPIVLDDTIGEALAFVVEVGEGSKTMFSCHIDTAENFIDAEKTKRRRKITTEGRGWLLASKGDEILGADDGAGVWLMLEMIDSKVPGVYVFHRGEEVGGVGSSMIARMYSDFLRRFKRAIAFDRKGTSSVITHQSMTKCCSDFFAETLAKKLSDRQYRLRPDNSGVFTDTACYIDFIPECTNISVGYFNEHSSREVLDIRYLSWLRSRCIELDWESLPTFRNPLDELLVEDYPLDW